MVTSDCARNQNMSDVNTNKLNGICGKTMCCMKYEDEAYKCAKKDMPDVGDRVKTKHGIGKVIKQNVLKKTLFIKLEKNNERVEVKA
jgi:cell fate regulator YaaT (PSP1 superfamily)